MRFAISSSAGSKNVRNVGRALDLHRGEKANH